VASSTLADVRRAEEGPLPRWGRWIGRAGLLLVVVAGAFGVFGVHSRTIRAGDSGYAVSVTYPQVARAGLDVPFRVEVQHSGGFASSLVLSISADYFRMFETQGFFPQPDSMNSDGTSIYLTFDHPRGEDFVVDYDAYIQPSAQIGKSADLKVLVGGSVVARTSLHTWLVP
jgi:hypothetical protein